MVSWTIPFTRRSILRLAAAPWFRSLTDRLYAFDNGTGRDQKYSFAQQADLVQRTGYAGIGYSGARALPALLKELDARKLDLLSIYVAAWADGRRPRYDPDLPAAIEQLKGRRTMVLLNIQAPSRDGDEHAVSIVKEIAELAEAARLRVCLYPHIGFHLGRLEDAMRITAAVRRPNVGIAFNLCHFLKAGDEANLAIRLQQVMPQLMLVSINGADHEGDWDRLIQPLDKGEFDVGALLRTLDSLGYRGPIALQSYNVKGPLEENLQRSMAAWRALRQRLLSTPLTPQVTRAK